MKKHLVWWLSSDAFNVYTHEPSLVSMEPNFTLCSWIYGVLNAVCFPAKG